MWNVGLFNHIFNFKGDGYAGINVVLKGMQIYLVKVYSSCTVNKKTKFQFVLSTFKRRMPFDEWCAIGDFNAIRKKCEKKGKISSFNRVESSEFDAFINSMELIDLPILDGG